MRTTAAGIVAAVFLRSARGVEAHIRHGAPTEARAGVVETVLGPLEASKLGFTLSHERVCVFPKELFSDKAVAAARMVDKLKEAKAAGVDTIIDLTTGCRARCALRRGSFAKVAN